MALLSVSIRPGMSSPVVLVGSVIILLAGVAFIAWRRRRGGDQ